MFFFKIIFAKKNNMELKQNNIHDIASYIGLFLLGNGMTVTPLKLQKILYYAQAWMMVFFEKQLIFKDVPEAWVNGPVYPVIYDRFKAKGRYTQLSKTDFVVEGSLTQQAADYAIKLQLTDLQLNTLNRLLLIYGAKNQDQLVFMTHCEAPWSNARKDLEPFEKSDNKISLDEMYSYYKERYENNRNLRK